MGLSKERFRRDRERLVVELAETGDHLIGEIDLVLSAYPDLKRPGLETTIFMEKMAELFIGDLDRLSESELKLLEGMASVARDMGKARLFDETYLGHMLTQASIPGMLGHMLGVRVGDNTVAREVSRFSTELEPEAIRGLAEIIGFDPEKADGTFTSVEVWRCRRP